MRFQEQWEERVAKHVAYKEKFEEEVEEALLWTSEGSRVLRSGAWYFM